MLYCVLFLGPISNISVLSEFNRRKLLVIQSFIFLRHSVSLDSLEVSSGLVEIYSVISITMETNPAFYNNITKGQHV